jgi:hypothetical protein
MEAGQSKIRARRASAKKQLLSILIKAALCILYWRIDIDYFEQPFDSIQSRLKNIILAGLIISSLVGCGSGSSSSGDLGATRALVRCVLVAGTSAIVARVVPEEPVTELTSGQSFDVAPFHSENSSGVPACQSPLVPSLPYQAMTTISCSQSRGND